MLVPGHVALLTGKDQQLLLLSIFASNIHILLLELFEYIVTFHLLVIILKEFFALLATKKPNLAVTVAAVFIASEENNSVPGMSVSIISSYCITADVGVEMLCKDGKVDFMKVFQIFFV